MSEPKKTESFAGNVMKYSIATYLGFGISGAALIIKGVLPAESYAVPASFMAYTMSLMNVGMLGLDQSLLRFYHEPPAGSTGRSMFAACTRLSVLVMLLVGGIGSIFFAKPLAAAFGLGANGAGLVPFLFLNAALYMLVRYLNVLLRLENNVRAYTTETLWMQACLNLIYLLPGFVTQDARAFVLGAVCSFAGVAVFYWRRASKGQTKEAPVRGLRPYAHIYRAALHYGIVLPLIEIWLGKQFLFDEAIVTWLIVNFYLTYMRKAVLAFRDASGLYWNDRYKPIAEAIINLAASVYFTINYGVVGVIWGGIISTLLTCFWVEPYVLFRNGIDIKLKDYFKDYLQYAVLSVLTAVVSKWLYTSLFNDVSIINFILGVILCLAISNVVWIAVFRKREEMAYLRNVARDKFGMNFF